MDRACEVDKGHGRIEKRPLEGTDGLAASLPGDWPGCHQVFRLQRERRFAGRVALEVVYGIARLPRQRGGAEALLAASRGPWEIENSLHGVRDGTLRADASRVRKGSGPQVMAALRTIAVILFERSGRRSAAAATRYYVGNPDRALELVSMPV